MSAGNWLKVKWYKTVHMDYVILLFEALNHRALIFEKLRYGIPCQSNLIQKEPKFEKSRHHLRIFHRLPYANLQDIVSLRQMYHS